MTAPNTHLGIDSSLCGEPVALRPGHAEVHLKTLASMVADDRGLVHGGFIFGLADYAAMLAVNDPNVVLGAADLRFVSPVKLGDVAVAKAELESESGKKRVVQVEVSVDGRPVLTGTLTAFVLPKHVLDA